MPSESPEPENYSISEMMDRLKEQRSGDGKSNGELVTRADGTQAIKVRGRKRRSSQPVKEKQQQGRRTRAIQIVVVLVLLFVVLASSVGLVIYMNGGSYRNKVLDRASKVTGSNAEMTEFRVTPIGANAQTLTLTWPETSPLRKLSLQGINAQLNFTSFLGQPWSGEEIVAQKGELRIDSVAPGAPETADASEFFRFGCYRCPDLTMYFGGNAQGAAMTVLNSEVSLYPTSASGHPELHLRRGKVHFRRDLGELEIDRALIGITGRQMNIVKMRLQGPVHPREDGLRDILPASRNTGTEEPPTVTDPRGALTLTGPLESASPGRTSTLDLKVEDLPIEDLAGHDLGSIFSGKIDSRDRLNSNFLSIDPASAESARFEVAFRGGFGSKLMLTHLPFLARLAALEDDSGYEKAVLDSGATGILRIDGSSITLDDLRLEVRSRMMLRGSITIGPNKALSGHMDVGLAIGLVDADTRLSAAFDTPREDMRWLRVNLSGTAAVPTDDFDKQVLGARSAPRGQDSNVAPKATAEDAFKDLTKPR